MRVEENVPLAPHTTFRIGGPARYFIELTSPDDILAAVEFAREKQLKVFVLGGGSNVLVPDDGLNAVVLKLAIDDITITEDEGHGTIVAGAGARWDAVVDAAASRGLWGIENLAGIPGTLGGAAVQNIGAYGAELKSVFVYADTIDTVTGTHMRITRPDALFGYRDSYFKKHRSHIVLQAALRLSQEARQNLSYPDLARALESGVPLTTPAEIAKAIRAIRSQKFPESGMAGSFFKNPVVSREIADALAKRYPGLPVFPQDGSAKLSLAWMLDRALALKGYARGAVRLYEKQPLVIVARPGARAADIAAFARDIIERVRAATGIAVDYEVEILTSAVSS